MLKPFIIESGKNKDIKTKCYYTIWNGSHADILKALDPYQTNNKRGKRTQSENAISSKIPVAKINKHKSYYVLPCSFDCETTNFGDKAYVYLLQFAIGNVCFLFKTIPLFFMFLDVLMEILEPPSNRRLLIFDVNLGFEFQNVLKGNIEIIDEEYDGFFKEEKQPLNVVHSSFFEFRECISWGGSLANLASNYTTTQKLKGDLDYTVLRNYNAVDNMTRDELSYCISDVIILTEFWQWYYNIYLSHNFCPLTIQGAIRKQFEIEFKKEYPNRDIRKFKELQSKNAPLSQDEYIRLMNGVYRGGYVHSDVCAVGYLFTWRDKIRGYDITSSYPASMLLEYVPGKFYKQNGLAFDFEYQKEPQQFTEMLQRKAIYFRATFKNIKSVGCHSLESLNKCKCTNAVIDNGRVYSADILTTWLTELDYANYVDFYTFDSVHIEEIYIARRQKLPKWYINVLMNNYVLKAVKKSNGENYSYEKSIVNSIYGCSVTQLNFCQLYYNGDTFREKMNKYEDINHNNMLLPQWGVWITAHSRRKIMKLTKQLYNIGKQVLYIDTDSVKILHFNDECQKIIDNANAENLQKVQKALEYYKLDSQYIIDTENVGETIGAWDCEYKNLDFLKVMGAKRYMLSYYDNKKQDYITKTTVAGLPKGCLEKYCDINNFDYYDTFVKDLTIEDCKLRSVYNDEEHTDIIDSVKMQQLNSLALVSTSFTLTLTKDFLYLIANLVNQENTRQFKNTHKFYI